MADEWHYSVKGSRKGPVSSAELKRMADAGELSSTDLVWKEGLQSWVAASNVKGLFPKPSSPPPLPPSIDDESTAPRSGAPVPSFGGVSPKPLASLASLPPVGGFHPQRLAVIATSIIGALATFMPWAHIGAVTLYGSKGDGWLTFILFVATALFAAVGPRVSLIERWPIWAAGICPALASLLGFFEIADINERRSQMASKAGVFGQAIAGATQTGFGVYLVIFCGLAAAAGVLALSLLHAERRGLR